MRVYVLVLLVCALQAAEDVYIPVKRFEIDGPGLIAASAYGNQLEVRRLLNKGVDINFQDLQGDTPLIAALNTYKSNRDKGAEETAYLLLASGANPDLVNRAGKSPRSLIRSDLRLAKFKKYLR